MSLLILAPRQRELIPIPNGSDDAAHAATRRMRLRLHRELSRHGQTVILETMGRVPRPLRALVSPSTSGELYARFPGGDVALLPRPVWRVRVVLPADGVDDTTELFRISDGTQTRLGKILFREPKIAHGLVLWDTLYVGN